MPIFAKQLSSSSGGMVDACEILCILGCNGIYIDGDLTNSKIYLLLHKICRILRQLINIPYAMEDRLVGLKIHIQVRILSTRAGLF